jgi:hypothetical protein
LRQVLIAADLPADSGRVGLDANDPDAQSLLLWYPTVIAAGNDYIRRAIKIESGAKSALNPHAPVTIRPFVSDDLAGRDLNVVDRPILDVGRKVCKEPWRQTVKMLVRYVPFPYIDLKYQKQPERVEDYFG